ncbi:MAG: ABC transporter ATP-binding protein [Ruminococcaceae bacterium]|nr:ABC transporter ATP-binding protein [Oscillospiraceae bacterium]
MKLIKKYIRPFLAAAIVCILLLGGQAILELMLPEYMSRIVNTGLQKGGIEQTYPEILPANTLEIFAKYMSDEDRELFTHNYIPLMALENKDEILEKYPEAPENALVISDELSKKELDALEKAFAKSAYCVYEVYSRNDLLAIDPNDTNQKIDPAILIEYKNFFNISDNEINELITAAEDAQETLVSSIATVFIKGIYESFGADLSGIQNGFIVKAGLAMLALSALNVACTIGCGYISSRVGAGVARNMRKDIFNKVTNFSSQEINKFSTASLITRTTNDVGQLQMIVTMGLRMMLFAPVMGIGAIVMALRKAVSMSWVIALAVICLLGLIAVLFSIAMPRFKKMQTLVDKLNLVTRENLNGMLVIRAFGTQDFEEKRFDKANKELTDNNLFVNRVVNLLMPAMNLIMNFATLTIIWIGSHKVALGAMPVGDMMAFMSYAMEVIMSFLFVSMMFMNIPRALVSANRIQEVMDTEIKIRDVANPVSLPEKPKGEIVFDNVSFRYEGAESDTLERINFTAEAGKTTAIIGSTGSGKSTLINLIPRFFDVTGGRITFDGVDIRQLKQTDLRDNIGFVPQKGVLFSGTIESNLRFGSEHAVKEALMEALDVAQATEFVSEKEDGIESEISQGGTNVSGGQRQRLSIARALVKKPPVYIFDDSFSALDFKTDAKLRKALNEYTGGATVIIVAQRISTIMNADKIIVLNDGEIAGVGKHRELLKNCETYREIAESQLSKEELEI